MIYSIKRTNSHRPPPAKDFKALNFYIYAHMSPFKKILSLLVACAAYIGAEGTVEFQRFSAVPVLGYTEETELQCGAMILLFLKPDKEGKKIPEIGFTAYGSSRGQLQIVLEPFLYLYHDKISLWFDLEYQDELRAFLET